jgi:hypothetical protein
MNEVSKPELAELGASFIQAGSEATRRVCEQGQSVAKTITEWNAEFGQFLSLRAARNGEAFRRITQCQSFPDLFSVQAQWLQDAADDYLREVSKLMEANGQMVGGLLARWR